jgi:hypothetical protein
MSLQAAGGPAGAAVRAVRGRAPYVVVPLLLVALAAALVGSQGSYESRNLDPEYIYLLNALNLLAFHAPFHTDHPGTTLHVLGAACLFVRWLGEAAAGGTASVQRSVLGDPEGYLRTLNLLLVMLVALAVYAAGRAAGRVANALPVGIALQLGAFSFATPLRSLSRVSPEPLLFALVFAFFVPLLPLIFASENEPSRGAAASGMIFGLGMVSKMTFLPLAAAAFFFRTWRARARFAFAAALTMAVTTLPIWSQLPYVARWMLRLLTHSGAYGEGRVGAPGGEELRANLGQVLAAEPLLLAWPLFDLAALAVLRFARRDAPDASSRATARALGLGALVIVGQAIATLKLYVGSRYLLPALAATALPNAALYRFLSLRRLRDGARRGLAIGGGVLFAASLFVAARGLVETVESDRVHRAEVRRLAEARRKLGDCLTVGYYQSTAGDYALHFGHSFTRPVHAAALESLHPGSLSFERFGSNRFVGFGRGRRDGAVAERLRQGGCVLLQGSILSPGEKPIEMPPGLALREELRGRYEVLSRVVLTEPR